MAWLQLSLQQQAGNGQGVYLFLFVSLSGVSFGLTFDPRFPPSVQGLNLDCGWVVFSFIVPCAHQLLETALIPLKLFHIGLNLLQRQRKLIFFVLQDARQMPGLQQPLADLNNPWQVSTVALGMTREKET
eukprot:2963767-Rhodomonas_salina.1